MTMLAQRVVALIDTVSRIEERRKIITICSQRYVDWDTVQEKQDAGELRSACWA